MNYPMRANQSGSGMTDGAPRCFTFGVIALGVISFFLGFAPYAKANFSVSFFLPATRAVAAALIAGGVIKPGASPNTSYDPRRW